MEFQVKATEQIARIRGIECRVWDAVSGNGLRCRMFVQSIAVRDGHDAHLLEQEIYESMPPGHLVKLKDLH